MSESRHSKPEYRHFDAEAAQDLDDLTDEDESATDLEERLEIALRYADSHPS